MLEAFFLGGVAEMVVSKSEGVIGVVVFKNEGMVGFPVVESSHDVWSIVVDAGVFDGPVVEECPEILGKIFGGRRRCPDGVHGEECLVASLVVKVGELVEFHGKVGIGVGIMFLDHGLVQFELCVGIVVGIVVVVGFLELYSP